VSKSLSEGGFLPLITIKLNEGDDIKNLGDNNLADNLVTQAQAIDTEQPPFVKNFNDSLYKKRSLEDTVSRAI